MDGRIRHRRFPTWRDAIAFTVTPAADPLIKLSPDRGEPRTVTFYALQMLDRKRKLGCRSTTVGHWETNLRLHIIPVLGSKKASALVRADSMTLLARLRSQPTLRSPNSIRAAMSTWYTLVRHMLDEEVPLPANIISRIGSPKQTYREVDFTAETIARVAAAMQVVAPHYEIAIWFASCAGLRYGEVFGMTWGNIDLARNRLSVTQQMWKREIQPLKTKSSRATLPIDPFLTDKLRAYRQQTPPVGRRRKRNPARRIPFPNDLVLVNCNNDPLSGTDFFRRWNDARALAEIPPRTGTFHSLRRYYISSLAASGQYSLTTIQSLARHASIQSTLPYVRAIDDPDAKGVGVFSAAFAPYN
ncbi:tyrosine-type recombinase/integrase [Streptomyces chartreusis]